MRWFLPAAILSSAVIPPILAEVRLEVRPTAAANAPFEVQWTRDEEDPGRFDLRLLLEGTDVGVVAGKVDALKGELEGTVKVRFPKEGSYTVVAIGRRCVEDSSEDQEDEQQADAPCHSQTNLAESTEIGVGPTPANPDQNPLGGGGGGQMTPVNPTSPPMQPTSSATDQPSTQPPSPASSFNTKRVAIIVGSVLGSTVFLLLFILGILVCRRRQKQKDAKTQRRITFHRDMMVQHRRDATDLERSAPSAHYLTTSSLPVPPHSAFPTVTTHRLSHSGSINGGTAPPASPYTPVHGGPTERQLQLNKRMRQLEEIMHDIRFRPGMSRVLEQLRVQVSWLRSQRNSPWALGETDTPPQHFDMYMGR